MFRSSYSKAGTVACTFALALSLVACGGGGNADAAKTDAPVEEAKTEEVATVDPNLDIMSYDVYMEAGVDDPVAIQCYVQGKQSWWENKATIYAQDKDGGYFIYNAECSEDDYAKLTEGKKIVVEGYKAEWSGEIEVADGAKITIIDDGDTYVAEAVDVTELLGSEELIDYQNQKVAFNGLTIAASEAADGSEVAFTYGADGSGEVGDDLYFKVSDGSETYEFTVESYLCDADSETYKAVEALQVGDEVDLEGFLYWYEGANPHITKVTVK